MAKLSLTLKVTKLSIFKMKAYLHLIAMPLAFFEVLFGGNQERVSQKYANKAAKMVRVKRC